MRLTDSEYRTIEAVASFGMLAIVAALGALVLKKRRWMIYLGAAVLGFAAGIYVDSAGTSGADTGPSCALIGMPLMLVFLVGVGAAARSVFDWFFPRPPQSERYCEACGYDLRATPNQCPECGSIPKAKAS